MTAEATGAPAKSPEELRKASEDAGDDVGVELSMAGWRLVVESSEAEHVDHVAAAMGTSCGHARPGAGADWSLLIETGSPEAGDQQAWPRLELRSGGPALTITSNDNGRLRAVARYRPQAAPVGIDVDRKRRCTRLTVSSTYADQTHWSAWLTKTFFASRMLAAGWQMLHASAVVLDGAAVVFVAAPGGGKSTLAHRACHELGAAFLADDLVLIGPEGTVLGWPTRVCLSYRLDVATSARVGLMENGPQGRRRLVLSLAEHRALGVVHAPPTPLGAVVHVRAGDTLSARAWTGTSRTEAQATAVDIPVQRLYTSDLLGLMGGPTTLATDRDVFAGVDGVELAVPDLANLPTLPVWEVLSAPLPQVSEAIS